jgi:hypothetical protein
MTCARMGAQMSEDNIVYGTDFRHKVKPRSKRQRELEEMAVRVFYESIGLEPPKESA